MRNLTYCKKRKIILSGIAVICLFIVTLCCLFGIYIIYDESLFTSNNTQSRKAEDYALAADSSPQNGVVFVGDSIFEMYNLDKYFRDKGYINRGIAGNQSSDVLQRLQTNVIDLKPQIVFLHVGTNDIGHGVSVQTMIANIGKIIEKIHTELPDCTLVVDSIYPTITLNNYNSKNLTKRRTNAAINNANDKLKNLCQTKQVTYLDTHRSLLSDGQLERECTIDGLHLSDLGYKTISKVFARQIQSILSRK